NAAHAHQIIAPGSSGLREQGAQRLQLIFTSDEARQIRRGLEWCSGGLMDFIGAEWSAKWRFGVCSQHFAAFQSFCQCNDLRIRWSIWALSSQLTVMAQRPCTFAF